MSNNSTLPATGDIIATEDIAGAKLQRIKLALGAYGTDDGDVSAATPLPVQASALPLPTGASTEATLAALNVIAAAIQSAADAINGKVTAVNTAAIAGTVALDAPTLAALENITASTGGLTDAQLRAAALPVSFSWAGLTDAQLRASNLPITLAALTYPASTNNSSTTQLTAGASFTGAIETIQNQQAAQISIVCDKAYTVQIQQFIDAAGTQPLPVDTFTRAAGVPLNENVTLPGDYFRLVVTNTSGSTTTTLNISTTFGIMNTQPRALTNEGRFPVEAARPPALLTSYNRAGVITVNTVLAALDCSVYRSVSIQCTSMGTTGVITPEWSNDGTIWVTATLVAPAGTTATTFSATGLWVTPVLARYLRLRLSTATTAGTTTLSLYQLDDRIQHWLATQQVGGTISVNGYPAAAASADALANPSITQIGAAGLVFNGTTWDRARGMSGNLTTGDTGAKSATGNGATIANVGNKGLALLVNLGAFVGGTTPSITFKLQGSPDGGTNWYDIPGATTAALTATGLFGITVYPGITATAGTTTSGTTATVSQVLPRTWRVVWTITGAPTSITITSVLYNYLNN